LALTDSHPDGSDTMSIPLNYSMKNLWLRRRATLAIVSAVALVVFVLATSLMLSTGVRSAMLRAVSAEKAIVLQHGVLAEDDSRIPGAMLALAAAAPGVANDVSGRPLVSGESVVHVPFPLRADNARVASVQIRGVTPAAFLLRPEVRLVRGRAPSPGADEAILGQGLADTYVGVAFGEGFAIKNGRKLNIVGEFEAQGSAYESEIWADLDAVRTAFGWEGYLSSVTAKLTTAAAFDSFAMALMGDKRNNVSVERETHYYEKISENLSAIVTGVGLAITLVFAIAAALGAVIGLDAAVSQRRREIGVLKALGFSQLQVLSAFLLEASMIAGAGALAGIALAAATQFFDITTANATTGQVVRFPFVLTLANLVTPIAVGALVGAVGGFVPALRASRMSALNAMRD
jgi:putative ABC transport system permease protein